MDNENNNQSEDQAPTPPAAEPTPAPEQQSQPVVAPVAAAPSAENPGKTLGIVGLIFAFLMPLVGLILSIIGLKKSKKAGFSNGAALAGIIISVIGIILGLILFSIFGVAIFAVIQKCGELGPGTHYVDGVTYTCN